MRKAYSRKGAETMPKSVAPRADAFRLEITFHDDGSWSYVSDTTLKVHGRDEPFRHRDVNTLRKVAEPTPNPLAVIEAGGEGRSAP